MTTATDPGTPIFDDLVRLLGAGALQPTGPAPSSPCTPPEWFAGWFAPPETHRHRDPEATAVMPAAGQERQAS